MYRCRRFVAALLGTLLLSSLAPPALALAPTATRVAPVAAAAAAAAAAPAGVPAAGSYVPLTATRLLDTRAGMAPNALGSGKAQIVLQVAGRGGVPAAGVESVALNVTVTQPSGDGWITVYPGGVEPDASNLNFVAGQTVANLVIVPLAADGTVVIRTHAVGDYQVIADVNGYYAAGSATAAASFTGVRPARIMDTRAGLGGTRLGPYGALSLQVTGRGGVPASGIGAVAVTVTVVGPDRAGWLTVHPGGTPLPDASTLNFAAGQTVPNMTILPVSADGRIQLSSSSTGGLHLIVDVAGYFRSGSGLAAGMFTPLSPTRLLDTRSGNGAAGPQQGNVEVQLAGRGGIPAAGVAAVVLNVTATASSGPGWIGVSPRGTSSWNPPSRLNFAAGQSVPNLVIAPLSPDGRIEIYAPAGRPHLIADVTGYIAAGPAMAWTSTMVDALHGAPVASRCTTTTFCAMVDEIGAVSIYDGRGWQRPARVLAGAGRDVSCVGVTFCMAVGADEYTTYRNGRWSSPVTPTVTFRPDHLDCASATSCVAVAADGSSWRFDGAVWTVVGPLGFAGQTVSCASATFCLAVGPLWSRGSATFDGTRWTPVVDLTSGAFADLVDCPSVTFCIGVHAARAAVFDGARWGTEWAPSQDLPFPAGSLSCSAATSCVAVGALFPGGPLLWARFDGTAWSAPAALFSGTNRGSVDPRPLSLSCVSAVWCLATSPGGSSGVFDGTSWSDFSVFDAVNGFTDVDCPTTTFCVAVGRTGEAFTFDGTRWTGPTRVMGARVAAVSCSSASFCLAVGGGGQVSRWSGAGWVAVPGADPSIDPADVSCVSPTYCIVVGDSYLRFDGSALTRAAGPDPWVDAVSCIGVDRCVAVSESGVYGTSGWNWLPVRGVGGSPTMSVHCTDADVCRFVDGGQVTRAAGWSNQSPSVDFSGPPSTAGVLAIDCVDGVTCVGVTRPRDDGTGTVGATTFDGATWSAVQPVPGAAGLIAVSCPSTSMCVSIDRSGLVAVGRR